MIMIGPPEASHTAVGAVLQTEVPRGGGNAVTPVLTGPPQIWWYRAWVSHGQRLSLKGWQCYLQLEGDTLAIFAIYFVSVATRIPCTELNLPI